MQENKREPAYLTAICIVTMSLAVLAAAMLLAWPALSSLLLSLKMFKPPAGLQDSPWVGLQNYQSLFSQPAFLQSLFATLRFSLLSALFAFMSSLAVGCLLLGIGRIRWLRHALCTLLLVPLVIPGEVWALAYFKAFTLEGGSSMFLIAFWCSLKYLGLSALLASAAIGRGRRGMSVPLMASGAIALILFTSLGRFDFNFLRSLPPPLYRFAGLDTYAFRSSIMQMMFSTGAAAGVLMGLARGLLIALAAWPIALLVRGLFPAEDKGGGASTRDRLYSLAVAGAAAVAIIIALASSVTSSAGNTGTGEIGVARVLAGIPVYLWSALFGALLNTMLCYLLAQPVVCLGKAGRIVTAAVLVVLTALGLCPASTGEFLLFRSLGLFNTIFAVTLSGLGSVWGAWALVVAAKGMGVSTNMDWYRQMWKPALALFAAQAALRFTDTLPSLLYTSKAECMSPFLLMNLDKAGALPAGLLVALLVFPVALILAARTALSEKDNLGMMLPYR